MNIGTSREQHPGRGCYALQLLLDEAGNLKGDGGNSVASKLLGMQRANLPVCALTKINEDPLRGDGFCFERMANELVQRCKLVLGSRANEGKTCTGA